MKTEVLGVQFDNITLAEAVDLAMERIERGEPGYVVTPNPEIVMACRADETLFPVVNSAALVLPDGIGVVYGAKLLGTPLKERVPGIEFAQGLMEKLAETGRGLFLFGGKPGIAEQAAEKLRGSVPGLRIVGCENGYFEDSAPIVETIRKSGADVVFVCLGAPKQERWMAEHLAEAGAKLMAGLGGTLDVLSGTVKRAPAVWQKLRLEWLYRGLTDPKRLGRTLKLPKFLFLVLGQRMRGKKS